jgi:hypothetical protein
MEAVRIADSADRNPDIVVALTYDETVEIQGFPGIEFSSFAGSRGMHGSFSPIDVHNTLVASGPHFKRAHTSHLPSGNVDVAPTIAHVLGLALPEADGRVLITSTSSSGASSVTRRPASP